MMCTRAVLMQFSRARALALFSTIETGSIASGTRASWHHPAKFRVSSLACASRSSLTPELTADVGGRMDRFGAEYLRACALIGAYTHDATEFQARLRYPVSGTPTVR
jgi:hypothetical protein